MQGPRVIVSHAFLTLLLLTACSKQDNPESPSAGPTEFPTPPITAPAPKFASTDPGYTNWWHEWSLDFYVGLYERHGRKNPEWDEPARTVLADYAHRRVFGKPAPGRQPRDFSNDLSKIAALGCDDPFLRYLHLRMVLHDPARATPEIAGKFSAAAAALDVPWCPSLIKSFVNLRAADAWRSASTNQFPEVGQFRQLAFDHLMHALAQDEMPIHVAYEICDEIYRALSRNAHSGETFRNAIEPILMTRWPDEAFTHLLKGRFYIDHAWAARGGGWANSVTDEAWALFSERLTIAERALEHAWALDPSIPGIPLSYLRLELGQGRGRDHMELWYQRAIAHPTQRYEALDLKLWYLQPRWYGSEKECLAAARAILKSDDFKGECPLQLYRVHASLADYFKDTRPDYWTEPQVWPDIQAAFERYFSLHESDHGWRHNYVLSAYQCRQWQVLREELAKLKNPDYAFFGGRQAFERMRTEAEAHAAK